MKKSLLAVIICSLFFTFTLNATEVIPGDIVNVTVKILTMDSFNENLNFSGQAFPYNEKIVKADISLRISKVYIVNGEWVERGKRLFMIDRKIVLDDIKNTEEDIKGWEKILEERRSWKERSNSSENDALKKIKFSKRLLRRLKYYRDNPYIISTISGRITVSLAKGDRVRKNSILSKITDDYIVKIRLSKYMSPYFKIGESVNLRLAEKDKMTFLARVKSDRSGKYLLVNNPKLLIHTGDNVFFNSKKVYKNSIILDNTDILFMNGKSYVYIVKNGWAVKKNVTVKLLSTGKYIVLSGIGEGEIIVSPIHDLGSDRVRVNIKKNLSYSDEKIKGKINNKKYIQKKRKTEFVISSGISLSKPVELNYRSSGTNELLSQYIKHYGLKDSQSGTFKENFLGIPLSITVNYPLKNGLYLKGGVEYVSYGNNSSKLYTLKWENLTEKFDYTLKDRITDIMPVIGIEKMFSSFSLYLSAGLDLMNIKHSDDIDYNSKNYSSSKFTEYNIKGKGFGILLGGKYIFKIGENKRLFLKVEYVAGKIGGFSGTKIMKSSDSSGELSSENISGDVYSYEYNPYNISWFRWWELSEDLPKGSNIRGVKKFSMNFSRLRLILGFAF